MEKIYKIKVTSQNNRETIKEGTISELTKYFSYTLEVGNSWNKRINKNPKTIKSFVTNLQNSYSEKESSCYNRTYVELM